MSLISSLYTGQTGLEASSTDLTIIGNNIANANTVGFKGSRGDFSDAMSQQMIGSGGSTSQMGLGTQLTTVQKILTQGALNNTGVATDLALDGNGFFVVNGSNNGQQGQFYTRDGQFTVDNSGFLTNQAGLQVQGYSASATGVVGSTLGSLQLGSATSPPLPTSTIDVKANLDAGATVPATWDPTNPVGTSNYSTSVSVYDSLGVQHQVDIYFQKTGNAANGDANWTYHAMTDGGGLTGGTAGVQTEVQSGDLTFDTTGKLETVANVAGAFNPLNATQAQALTLNLGDDTTSGGTGLLGVTQFAQPSSATAVTQDGYGAGVLSSISIDKSGVIQGAFSNGQSLVVGQVAVASVDAPDQMASTGGNLFALTSGSGTATVGKAGTGGRGAITAGALENSNVDMSNEFINMIAAQRNYEANAKTITTADTLLSDLMNMKR